MSLKNIKNDVMNRNLIILVFVLIVLVILDLSLGIGYVTKANLHFNPENFNNVLSPLFSLLALFASLVALLFSFGQNKLALSQNLKPHYEMEIERLKNKAFEIQIQEPGDNEVYNAINYIRKIEKTLLHLSQNDHYKEDYDKSINKEKVSGRDYFASRSYYGKLLFLMDFITLISPVYFYYARVTDLITQVDNSKLIPEDKFLLKKRIRDEFLEDYIAMVGFMKSHRDMIPTIPDIYTNNDGTIKFRSLADSNFASHWFWFEEHLKLAN